MKNENDAQLIDDILSGDGAAFNTLVHKYQKGVHALAWRKIGDFHYAEEITQDAFLKAYKNLTTLKDPNQFAGWLYVIANRLCINWIQRNKSAMQSLEDTPVREIEQSSYTRYVSEQREARATEERYDLAKRILEKLPESERTVMTLYYLGEMTTKEISRFLGVSVNTITSRLQRARRRLQKDQELLIQEVLGSVLIPASLTENIMQQVTDIKPTPSSAGKPFLPWLAFGTAIALIAMLLGTSNQYLLRFQKPYSFEAQSQPTIEITEAPITLNIESKPAVRTQTGNVATSNENSGVGLQASENILTPNTQNNRFRPSTSQWIQANGPQGSHISEIFLSSKGRLYTATPTGIYTLTADATAWTLLNTNMPTGNYSMPMAMHNDSLYIVSADEIFTSTDGGETWNILGSRPEGEAIGLIIKDKGQRDRSLPNIVVYLALEGKGVFRSTDAGRQWNPLNDGLQGKRIYAVDAVGNTVFVGTNEGMYRLNSNSDVWEKLPVDPANAIHSLAVLENDLYVATGPDSFLLRSSDRYGKYAAQLVTKDTARPWKIFHSADLGASWAEITPQDKPSIMMTPRSIEILTAGKALLALGGVHSFRSKDAGRTWTNLEFNPNSVKQNIFTATAIDENTYYIAGGFGVYRTIDGGESWHPCMTGMIGTTIQDLTAFNDRLYGQNGSDIVQSTDGGETWESIQTNPELIGKEQSRLNLSSNSKLVVSDGELYRLVPDRDNLYIFRLSMNGNIFIPIQGVPTFDEGTLSTELWITIAKAERVNLPDDIEKNAKLITALRKILTLAIPGGFVVSNDTFYMEHTRRLFKWKPGDPQWTNTGLIDLGKQPDEDLRKEFRLAVSGETVYVGKRAGRLFQSLDSGDTWKDITPVLPLHFERFNQIIFAGFTVYVATDKGVIASRNGESWRNLTDEKGTPIVIDRLVIDHTTIYGAGGTGLYRLDPRSKWQQISPSVPDKVISLVTCNNRLYIATQHRGMFHIPLQEETISQIELTTDSNVAY